MLVSVIEVSTDKIISDVVVSVRRIDGFMVNEEQYFDEAWQAVVEDGLVDKDARHAYKFLIRER